ncbi:hypothetical protein IAE35_04780 [Pseudomonas sp. S75]|uniref:hypothetical protein n=1 Tax=unclassified Pseudomonas TaxID=196821 RepID=UPI001905CB4D|nr:MULTISPECIES: hypothetical protein [unclassified Pseudomonas]MBJ9975381.1 hypothetical protein [Pseudomonas sp. S30]MBK0152645.1 hypothetical protein [Pseudomonas sp. S75]
MIDALILNPCDGLYLGTPEVSGGDPDRHLPTTLSSGKFAEAKGESPSANRKAGGMPADICS